MISPLVALPGYARYELEWLIERAKTPVRRKRKNDISSPYENNGPTHFFRFLGKHEKLYQSIIKR